MAMSTGAGRPSQLNDPYRALYLHIPFCKQRCGYCDFTAQAAAPGDPRVGAYVERLVAEVRAASRDGLLGSIQSIYLGGGTPSYLGLRHLVSLVYTLSLSVSLHDDTEFTIEANPESLNAQMVRDLYALGVNRFSLGVQSFDDGELRGLGRIHDARMAREAIAAAQSRAANVSIDLMCGIPGQSRASWNRTLHEAVASGVGHVSVYPLVIEEGTPFAQAVDVGLIAPPDEDLQATMMEQAATVLEAAGLMRYEVASYAKPGYECRHNCAYWTGVPYLGLGTGAAGMHNTAQGRERLYDGTVVERLTKAEACAEDLMLGMRMTCGVGEAQVRETHASIRTIEVVFAELVEEGLAVLQDGRYRPTQRGWLLGNELYGRIWGSVCR
jgi:oxygen-independent coproporphyrinogen-3 oxidase